MTRFTRIVVWLIILVLFIVLISLFVPEDQGLSKIDIPRHAAEEVNNDDLERFSSPVLFEQSTEQVYNKALNNATTRAILGRSTWTLLHTMAARYPDNPSAEQQADTVKFIGLLSRMYPCGECAKHFKEMLREHPPQVASQKSMAAWLCKLHNIVNVRLSKPVFDCNRLEERWDCGCTER